MWIPVLLELLLGIYLSTTAHSARMYNAIQIDFMVSVL